MKPANPLPWTHKIEPISYPECGEQDLPCVIRDWEGSEVVTLQESYGSNLDEPYLTNATFIVRACNNHHALLEALERALPYIEDAANDCRDEPSEAKHALAAAQDAIAKAKGDAS